MAIIFISPLSFGALKAVCAFTRPTTKMPRFFGLWDHLVPVVKTDETGHPVKEPSRGLTDAERFEPIEIRAALAEGKLKGNESIQAQMVLTIGKVGLTHKIDGTIELA